MKKQLSLANNTTKYKQTYCVDGRIYILVIGRLDSHTSRPK